MDKHVSKLTWHARFQKLNDRSYYEKEGDTVESLKQFIQEAADNDYQEVVIRLR